MLILTHLVENPSIKSFHCLSVDAKSPCSALVEQIIKDLFTIMLRISYHRREVIFPKWNVSGLMDYLIFQ